jgi:hypothetical protein
MARNLGSSIALPVAIERSTRRTTETKMIEPTQTIVSVMIPDLTQAGIISNRIPITQLIMITLTCRTFISREDILLRIILHFGNRHTLGIINLRPLCARVAAPIESPMLRYCGE